MMTDKQPATLTAKPLSEAQKRRLLRLVEERDRAMADVNEFVAYLQDEHGAPPQDGWVINDINVGFVKNGDAAAETEEPTADGNDS